MVSDGIKNMGKVMPITNDSPTPTEANGDEEQGDDTMNNESGVNHNLNTGTELETVVKLDGNVEILDIDKLEPFKNHHFKRYEGTRFDSLRNSIKENGFWGLIIVRPHPDEEGKYEILCGHNRYYAVKSLNQPTITAQVISGLSDDEAENMVNRDNYDHQSFLDWGYLQQLRVIKI